MTAPIRWGLMAAGGIARAFAHDVKVLPDAEVLAVGSRAQETADAFAAELDIPRAYGTYADLAADPDIDAIYVSPPHPGHLAATVLSLEHGKAVLCEKPFAMDRAEAQRMVDVARANGAFLMEAMWTRFLPHVVRIREILAAGTLGELVYLTAEHGQWFAHDAAHRLFAPPLGGGALLDLGIYPISFAHMVFGAPASITAVSTPAFTGVDGTTSMLLRYDSGAHAVLTTTLAAKSSNPAVICGTDARLEIDGVFYTPTSFRVISRDDKVLESFTTPPGGRGMEYEAAEVGRCLRAGLTESPILPLNETVAIMGVLDEIRAQIGLDYAKL
jgi:predicted dehydrogenase